MGIKAMNILHILGQFHLPQNPDQESVSGVVRSTLETACVQARMGHSVTIAVAGQDAWRVTWRGVNLVSLKRSPWANVRLGEKIVDYRQHVPYIVHTLRNNFDVIHGQMYSNMRFLRAGARVVHFRSDPFEKGSKSKSYSLKPADFSVIRRFSDVQIANSQYTAGQVQRGLEGQGDVHVVYNGVDRATFDYSTHASAAAQLRGEWGVPTQSVVFLYAGVIVPEKGVLHLARAFARLAETNPHVHLALAGAKGLWGGASAVGDAYDVYEQQVRRTLEPLTTARRVHFLGKVAVARMPAMYAAGDVLVVPSTWQEAFGNVAVEAMALGRPVIASRTGGLVEIVNDQNGCLAAPGDEEALLTAMRTLTEDADLRERLGRSALQSTQRFSWERGAEELDRIYRHAITKRASTSGKVKRLVGTRRNS
jgi:glycosyltransferase involved in cell wall biosynthesis